MWTLVWLLCTSGLAMDEAAVTPQRPPPFGIEVVDDATGRGVPLVELRTVHGQRYFTDSAGWVAIEAPELAGQQTYFHVSSHGYEYPADGFGYRGKALHVRPGGFEQLKIKRLNLAERMYRVTGAGIYADSVALGRPAPTRQPLLNGQVFGSDSVVNAIYRGRLYWFWGDTNRPAYPLGNFHVPGATSRLPADGGLNPSLGVDLEYFVNAQGFAKETARMEGAGPTWIGGLVVLPDRDGRERMWASYVKVRKQLEIYRRGLVEFDDERQEFVHQVDLPLNATLMPDGHGVVHSDGQKSHVYFARPYPWTRVAANIESLRDLAQYEGFTCLRTGDRAGEGPVERDDQGQVVWGWKRDAAPLAEALQKRLLASGQLKPDEAWLGVRDRDSARTVVVHGGSVAWNAYLQRWVMIFVELGGSSMLGEVWYADAPRIEGPWRTARKIVTHQRYSFYNPKQHPQFEEESGRRIYFEGTYTHTFSGNADQTPRYDYNQVMYRLDLSDSRVHAAPSTPAP